MEGESHLAVVDDVMRASAFISTAMIHLFTKFGENVFIKSENIDIFRN